MMENKLILHIGTPKTGTSALQRFLYDNANVLKEKGFCYPDLVVEMENEGFKIQVDADQRDKNGCVFNSYISAQDGNRTDVSRNEDSWNTLWKIIRKHLETANVIISEESIWWWNTISFLEAVKKEFENVQIVVYLRRQDRYIESDWNQRVKRYNFCSDTFEVDRIKRKNNPIFHYLKKLEEIEGICGFKNLFVRVYEKAQFAGSRGDIVSDFLYCLGMDVDLDSCVQAKLVNESLSGNLIEIKRNMNAVMDRNDYSSRQMENRFLEYLGVISSNSATGKVKGVESCYTDEERLTILANYAEENRIIAEKYLGRQDGKLFYEEVKGKSILNDKGDIYEDIIKVFTYLSLEQEKRINRLEQQRKETLELIFKMKERDIILFGAGAMCRDILRQYDLPVRYIVDNCSSVEEINGIPVISPEDIDNWKEFFVIISCRESKDIEKQLMEYGLRKYKDYVFAIECLG